MTFWSLLGIILVAGAIGGILYSLISDKGFQLPGIVKKSGTSILVLGFIGDIIIGAITAGISWAFYVPLSQVTLETTATIGTIFATVLGGVFTGLAGSGWFSNTAGRTVVRVETLGIAKAPPSMEEAAKSSTMAPPSEAEKMGKEVDTDMEGTTLAGDK